MTLRPCSSFTGFTGTLLLVALVAQGCASTPPAAAPAAQPPPQQQPYAPAGYPPQGYPAPVAPVSGAQPYAPPPQPQQPWQPQPSQPPQAAPQPVAAPVRPLLPPLLGTVAWQAEVRGVIAEDVAALGADNQARVRGIPLVFDPNPFEVNAYAMCDEQGHPGIVGTEGLLEAMDAIAQTRATDELYGTHTYDLYTQTVIPNLAQSPQASAGLPLGIIAPNVYADPRRLSRAHEWFDEIAAFTFGHELSHHYLGHTGCAYGSAAPFGALAQMAGKIGNGFIQPLEFAADVNGATNMLDAGRARSAQAYRWREEGGLALLDFFLRLENATGPSSALGKAVVSFLNTHPSSSLRIPVVQTAARTWYLQHPG